MEMIGTISPQSVLDCEVFYRSCVSEDAVELRRTTSKLVTFHDGSIHLEGESDTLDIQLRLPKPKLMSTSKRIQLHEVPFGLQSTQHFNIRNIGSGPALVYIHNSSADDEVNLVIDNNPTEIRSQECADFKVFNFKKISEKTVGDMLQPQTGLL